MKKKSSLFATISGICFILHWFIEYVVYSPLAYGLPLAERIANPRLLIQFVALIVFAVMLALRKKNVIMLCSWCVMAVCSIIWCVKLISRLWYPFSFEVSYTLSYTLNIAWLLFIAAVLLVVCLPGLKIFAEKLSALWFVPIILISGEWVAYNCTQKYWFRMLIYAYANVPHWYKIFDLIEVAAVVFFCLWLWYDWGKPKWTKKAPVVAEAAPVLSVADQLLHYKELLDMGAITQEEFDAKKKELLS